MNTVTQMKFKDGDDGGDLEPVESIAISVAENGYIITMFYEDGEESQYVFQNTKDLIARIKKEL